MELTSSLTLEMLGQPFLLEKRIKLLHAINEHGSISKAAKAVPMSYKSAWEAVDAMNSLSTEPIVERETGGKNGGGTTITVYGKKLLAHYALLKQEHNRFMERLAVLADVEGGTLGTIGRMALQLSARNQIQARVENIMCSGVSAEVALLPKGGQQIISKITAEAVGNLHLEVGDRVIAVCKSSNVFILREDEKTDANCLKGKVVTVEQGSDSVKIVVDIGGHDRIVSVMPLKHFGSMSFQPDDDVRVAVKARDVMIGR
ncbi:TOBE domain-containing protein [Sulfurovum sp.]|uniref:TOBE domain-containing protein n=1 Tax=Sulfurovum sp. TaxID=1969726 RepID=UPI0025FD68E5|nr:TOBE domain-containing protein [Sulfurovum sp.]